MREYLTAATCALLGLEAMAVTFTALLSMVMYAVGLTDVGEPWGLTTGVPVVAVILAVLVLVLLGLTHVVRTLNHRTRRRSWSLSALAVLHAAYGTTLLLEGRPQYAAALLAFSALQTVAAAPAPRGLVEYRLA
ncbi:hypothetical protein ACIA8O_15465 [Kitasatospora sp. NPDC051853]|uniref:hypothetical protein n=1 Tax=Kitasatospora sp. NPDC051853 TaxID=3364058 RepID=UPI00379ECF8B